MSDKIGQTSLPGEEANSIADVNRRRPGRVDVSILLIPLLRSPIGLRKLADEDRQSLEKESADHFATARGIVIASVLSALVWIVLGATAYLLLRSR